MPRARTLIVFALAAWHIVSACEEEEKIDISSGQHLPSGDIVFDGVVFEKGDYHVESATRTVACEKPVVRKCCPFGEIFSGRNCSAGNQTFDGVVWNEYSVIEGARWRETFRFKIEKIKCKSPYVRVLVSALGNLEWSDNWHLRWDGKLFVELTHSIAPWTLLTSDQYCIDSFVYDEVDGSPKVRLEALACFVKESGERHYEINSACMLVSCAFILLTVLVYIWLPELRNIHGRVLMAYLICLFVGFICMASMQIMLTIDSITKSDCVILTIIIYFALQSAFFWLNVMSFDIWWTFSGKGGMALKNVSKRFFAYSLYAFGVPIVLTIILVSLQFSGLPAHPLLPMISDQGCFLFGNSKLLYLYGPMLILCLANIVFFIMTAVKIAQIKQETEVLYSNESAKHVQHTKDKQRLLLYVKLFTVMGINWILEVVGALYPDAEYIWKVTDVYNVLIGVIIFFIFVWKRKIFHLIKKRYRQLRGEPMSRNQTVSTRTMSSRDDIPAAARRTNVSQPDGVHSHYVQP